MAYFALQVVVGREMAVKNALVQAISNQRRTDIKEIIVPSQIVLDLKGEKQKKYSSKTVVALPSYVFISVESGEGLYHELNGVLYSFLNSMPNVCKVITQSIPEYEMEEMLAIWNHPHVQTKMVFKIELDAEQAEDKTPYASSAMMKAKELIAKKQVISNFKRMVHLLAAGRKKNVSSLSYVEEDNLLVISAPLTMVIQALERLPITLEDLKQCPHKLLNSLTGVCYDNSYSS